MASVSHILSMIKIISTDHSIIGIIWTTTRARRTQMFQMYFIDIANSTAYHMITTVRVLVLER